MRPVYSGTEGRCSESAEGRAQGSAGTALRGDCRHCRVVSTAPSWPVTIALRTRAATGLPGQGFYRKNGHKGAGVFLTAQGVWPAPERTGNNPQRRTPSEGESTQRLNTRRRQKARKQPGLKMGKGHENASLQTQPPTAQNDLNSRPPASTSPPPQSWDARLFYIRHTNGSVG